MTNERKMPGAAIAGALTTGAALAGGMIMSEVIRNQVVAPTRARTLLDITVQFTARGTVILPGTHKSWTSLMGLRTARAIYRLGPVPEPIDPTRSSGCEREYTRISGPAEPPGTYGARFYTYQWYTAEDAGLKETTHTIPTPFGLAPAKLWQAPQAMDNDTWVIGVHGRSAVHEELLRMAVITCNRGFPFLAVSYRNDQVGGPHTDGVSRMGATEWEDLDWAIKYALQHGAKRVILLGASQGASLVAYWLAHAQANPEQLVSDPESTIGIILDCPLIQGSGALRATLTDSGFPSGFDKLFTMAASGWMGVRGPRKVVTVNHLPALKACKLPILLFAGLKDTMIRPEAALELSHSPHVTTLVHDDAEHIEVYNEDEEMYTEIMAAWLQKLTEPLPPFTPSAAATATPPRPVDDEPSAELAHFKTEQIIPGEDA